MRRKIVFPSKPDKTFASWAPPAAKEGKTTMEPPPVKGTVTPFASLFSQEETQKASERVRATIGERQKELEQLQGFLHDNTSLVNLVQKLPDQLHHNIMVPFGKAAFFPGQLIHTNEFMVLLGEGYFAERTSKQTVEILKRRGKGLESQVDGLKAVMQDLKAEISFFNDTAAHIAEGVVEIREDYSNEASNENVSTFGVSKPKFNFSEGNSTKAAAAAAVEDEEYARLLSRMEELEKEELEAEAEAENGDESEKDDEANIDDHLSKLSLKQELLTTEKQQSKAEQTSKEESIKGQSMPRQSDFESSKTHTVNKELDLYSHEKVPASSRSKIMEKIVEFPKSNENGKLLPASTNEVPVTTPVSSSSSTMAFTGSIVEHTHNIDTNPREQSFAPTSKKPVSRFKQQRR